MSRKRVDALFAPFHQDPSHSGLFVDFDGTLSAVVDDPGAARPVAGAMDALDALARRLDRVWVISGRPVAFLDRFLPPSVHASGLYGLETSIGGVPGEHPDAARWRPIVAEAVAIATNDAPVGAGVEPKGLSLTLHYRTAPDVQGAVEDLARRLAATTGLEAHVARMSVELRAPIATDKGTALALAAAGLATACFIGDDRGDLPAFDVLDAMAGAGTHTVRVAVASPESPAELVERADLVLRDPAAVVELLASLGSRA